MLYYFCHFLFTIFQTLFIGVWQVNLETKLCQEVRRFCFNVPRAFALKMWKLLGLCDVRCLPKCRSAIFAIRDDIFAIIINPWFVEVFGIVSSTIDITVSLNFKIFSVHRFVQRAVSFVKFMPCRFFTYSRI